MQQAKPRLVVASLVLLSHIYPLPFSASKTKDTWKNRYKNDRKNHECKVIPNDRQIPKEVSPKDDCNNPP